MQLEIGVGDLLVGANEASRFEVVGGRCSATKEQPLKAQPRLPPPLQLRLHGDWKTAGMLDVDLQVVLEVAADAGEVVHDVDVEPGEVVRVTPTGELQELRRVESPPAGDDSTASGRSELAALAILHPHRSLTLKQNPSRQGPTDERQVGPMQHRVEIGPGSAQASPPHEVAVEGAEALLAKAVNVVSARVARLLSGRQEGIKEWILTGPGLESQGSLATAVVVPAREAVLGALEVGQAVSPVPGLHALVATPLLEVERVAADEDHAVDARGATEDFAPSVGDPPSAHVGLGLGLVAPVVERVANRDRERGRHVDEDVPQGVWAARFEDQDAVARISAQPRRQGTASGAAAEDNEVVGLGVEAYQGLLSRQTGLNGLMVLLNVLVAGLQASPQEDVSFFLRLL